MCCRAVAWISNVAYVCATGLKGLRHCNRAYLSHQIPTKIQSNGGNVRFTSAERCHSHFLYLGTKTNRDVVLLQEPPAFHAIRRRKLRLGDLRIFRCHICGYTTKNRTHLQHHSLIHTGEKPYVCSFCPASFTFKGSMKRHERTHTGERPFTCSRCHYSSNQRSSLFLHMQKHHSENT